MFHAHCSMAVFNFPHPPLLSALFLTLSDSRSLVPDFPLLVPAPILSSAPLHGITFHYLTVRNPLWTPSNLTSNLSCFPFRAAVSSSASSPVPVHLFQYTLQLCAKQYNAALLPSVNISARGMFCCSKYTHHTFIPIIKHH